MRYSSIVAAVAASASLVAAAPIESRDYAVDYTVPGGDATILNYALTLEYLERKFYSEGIAMFNKDDFVDAGFPDPFYDNLKEVYYDEMTHVSTLAYAIKHAGYTPVTEATYKFPFTDAKSFVALASVLEGVGVSAYLGAAASIVNKAYLTVAGSILTIESRHSSYIRAALGESPFPKPFDTPLDFNQVYSLASQFIVAFAEGAAPLPFKAFPPLSIDPSQYVYTANSSTVTFDNAFENAQKLMPTLNEDSLVYAVFFSGLNIYYVPVYVTRGGKDYKVVIPGGDPNATPPILPPTGQVYIVLSTADGVKTTVSDENTLSGVGLIEVSPPGDRTLF